MDTRSHAFITWVSDAPEVRDALRFLLMDIGDRLGPLANEEGEDLHRRPSAMLAALVYAYSPHADVPDALRHSVKGALRDLARNRQLTPPMVELMLRLNPNALDDEFSPDIAGDIDARLSLPSGTTGRVLAELLQERSAPPMPWISRVADRAHQVIPTVATPDYRRWMGSGTASREVIFGSLVAAGHVLPRSGQSVAEHLATVRDVWAARTSSTRPGAAQEG
ncbi:hypothetical protein ACFXKD_00280 [Nocardiopsis aegyptia]|uniref:hypothetical protein n=1 Tax=Nocardiopsis aegyptia TaxID=220378 RepID=UPI00366D9ABC